ncbi:MAG: hypothetical protein NVSMB32_18800 [Actinomycetota bacterium]
MHSLYVGKCARHTVTMADNATRLRRWHVAAGWLGALAVAEVLAAAVLCLAVGWSWQQALNAFVATNCVMGLAGRCCGPSSSPPRCAWA